MGKIAELKPRPSATVFDGKAILIPFARTPGKSSKAISPSKRLSEMSPETVPKGIANRLMESVAKYGKRFGHPFPSASLQHLSRQEKLDLINKALESGQPPPGWEKMPMGDVVIAITARAMPTPMRNAPIGRRQAFGKSPSGRNPLRTKPAMTLATKTPMPSSNRIRSSFYSPRASHCASRKPRVLDIVDLVLPRGWC